MKVQRTFVCSVLYTRGTAVNRGAILLRVTCHDFNRGAILLRVTCHDFNGDAVYNSEQQDNE